MIILHLNNEIILGVLLASLCSGFLGFAMIFWSLKKKEKIKSKYLKWKVGILKIIIYLIALI